MVTKIESQQNEVGDDKPNQSNYWNSSSKIISEDASLDDPNNTKKVPGFGYRHVQIGLLFVMLAVGYSMRVNLSIGIVAMTNGTTTENPDIPWYNWKNQSVILSSFFWGYICLQIFAGQLGQMYGTKWLAFTSMGINSTACFIIPYMAAWLGDYGVIACRVVQGLSQGFFFPSVHNILGKWAPLNERSFLSMIAFAGPSFGTIVSLIASGAISASWLGWPYAFYIFGGLGYVWMVFWAFLAANTPASHPNVSKEEREYIEHSLSVTSQVVPPTPWKKIFTSVPVWAFIITMFGQNWGYSTLLTEIPNYLNKIMHFNMKSNSVLSAAPYATCFLLSFVFGAISDFLINRKYFTRVVARKVFNTVGIVGPAIALAVLSFLPESQSTLSVIMLIIAVGVNSAAFVGFQINPVDLAPRYSGVLMGIGNGSSNIFSILAPLTVQFVVGDKQDDKSLWRIIFIVAACVYTTAAIIFIIFGSAEVQPWNDEEQNDRKNEEREKEKV